jgi:hypothetical protein
LDRHDAEVDKLYSRPDHVIGLERRHIDVLELALHSTLATTLGNCHEGEEGSQTSWSE